MVSSFLVTMATDCKRWEHVIVTLLNVPDHAAKFDTDVSSTFKDMSITSLLTINHYLLKSLNWELSLKIAQPGSYVNTHFS